MKKEIKLQEDKTWTTDTSFAHIPSNPCHRIKLPAIKFPVKLKLNIPIERASPTKI